MSTENTSFPSNEEMQSVFDMSKDSYNKEIAHYEILAKEKPELAHLFSGNTTEEASTSPVIIRQTEFVSGHFNINTYYQYGYYPFIQISSNPVIIGHEPNIGKRTSFNAYVYGGYNLPQMNFYNIHLGGVVNHAQSIINSPLSFQLFINPKNMILRLYSGNVYLGDLFSVYQNNLFVTYPIILSGVGSFTLIP
ncbi:hypothetical protein HZS38_03460 [Xenorhabdus nematophila]|uniref:Uncharacterized protein n=1 Tax=Xenorhabdus nematophila (strain ATCC 19061 / DSM 3370 / CCUG 14189 / LMG 1036 / NCIMB 9965 / AN6) TaxID=406817 RepID=D3VAR6_XENNA|nr:hypothetical protein [Xenorhabdus nematophila]CEE92277.1 conserved hypothetical protein [Xenorhabdus nematophila str. Anatoliense]CEF33451.1 conserved hypothetical protein [Xenorhabdus nematophila str. Websteri]AYA39714.1 hypothetical protein D3790_03840 [Xenorhabdus nematophila]KHD27836.1 hypothetical protein LH67_14910 [Xenorhabdus nematophila]MBA0018285.1 hypothetical protein [Xenorhabdus nematophila]